MYHLEERSVSTDVWYKKCAQIFVVDVNKSPIRYIFRDATMSYAVWCEHDLKVDKEEGYEELAK